MTSYFSIPISDIFQDTLTVVGLMNMTVMSPGAWLAEKLPMGTNTYLIKQFSKILQLGNYCLNLLFLSINNYYL